MQNTAANASQNNNIKPALNTVQNTNSNTSLSQTQTTSNESLIDNPAVTVIFKIVSAILVFMVLLYVSKKITKLVKSKLTSHNYLGDDTNNEKIANLVSDIVFYTLLIFSFFIGFQVLGFDVWLILWGVSFGVWLAFKETLGNMIAGIMILATKQIKIGDIIEITDSGETFFGRIEEITIRNTIIRTLDLRQVVLPNMTLISRPIKTFSAEEIVRLDTEVQVDYATDLSLAQKVIIDAINTLPFVMETDKTKAIVRSFDESGITIRYYFYFDPKAGLLGDYAKGYVNEKVNEAFKEHGISIPFPHRTLVTKEVTAPIQITSVHMGKDSWSL